jgi:hypothetical protein
VRSVTTACDVRRGTEDPFSPRAWHWIHPSLGFPREDPIRGEEGEDTRLNFEGCRSEMVRGDPVTRAS